MSTIVRPIQLVYDAPWLGLLILAWLAGYGSGNAHVREWSRTLAACWIAMFLLHVGGGAWHTSYMFALVPSTAAIVSCLLSSSVRSLKSARLPGARSTIPAACVVATSALLLPACASSWQEFLDRPEPIRQVQRISSALDGEVPGTGDVFAMSASVLIVESRYDPGDSPVMGRFAYLDLAEPRARDVGAINEEQIASLMASRRPTALILTEQDLFVLLHRGTFSQSPTRAIVAAICRNYLPVRSFRRFGEDDKTVTVWVRRGDAVTDGITNVGTTPAAITWMRKCEGVTR
jgi:hypothetical protein